MLFRYRGEESRREFEEVRRVHRHRCSRIPLLGAQMPNVGGGAGPPHRCLTPSALSQQGARYLAPAAKQRPTLTPPSHLTQGQPPIHTPRCKNTSPLHPLPSMSESGPPSPHKTPPAFPHNLRQAHPQSPRPSIRPPSLSACSLQVREQTSNGSSRNPSWKPLITLISQAMS